jgi:ferrochelatase
MMYQKIWTEEGSPLWVHHLNLAVKLQQRFPLDVRVFSAMRYGNPSLKGVLEKLCEENPDELVILPMFPQEASSTTGSVFKEVRRCLRRWKTVPVLRFVDAFYHHPAFIKAFVNNIQGYQPGKYDRIVFSYHSLPHISDHRTHSYRAACYETSRLLSEELNLQEHQYLTTFQSAMGKDWLHPFTDQTLISLAGQGIKKVLVVLPGFVADNLETLFEVKQECRRIFKEAGGEELVMVESLNDREEWVEALYQMIKCHLNR